MTAHEGTQVVGTLTAGRGKGLAFATERRIGKGKLVLLGAMPHGDNKDGMLNTLIHHYAGEAGVSRLADTPSGVVIVPRTNNRGTPWSSGPWTCRSRTAWRLASSAAFGLAVQLPVPVPSASAPWPLPMLRALLQRTVSRAD